jgi:NAD(P)-dependent dehydrogenase (short-subunit alcohol dehydrogenase family)
MTTNDDDTMEGRICVVTGATSGLGKATALGLAARGATLVLVCRDRDRGERVRQEIRAATGNPNVECALGDLSDPASIRECARAIMKRHPAVRVLVNQAGLVTSRREVTRDGLEMMFAVNHLAYFALANGLRPALQAGAPSRIINVGGGIQAAGDIHFEDLQAERRFGWFRQLAQSKLANVLFTYEMARRLEGTGVTVNCVDPGGVRTNLGKHTGGLPRVLATVFRPLFATPERGAQPAIWLASSPALERVTGRYYQKKQDKRSSPKSYDEAIAARLWDVSAELAHLDG